MSARTASLRVVSIAAFLAAGLAGAPAWGQEAGAAPPAATPAPAQQLNRIELWSLFESSFDLFTILILLGSLAASAVIVRCVLDVRAVNVMPEDVVARIDALIDEGRRGELGEFVRRDDSLPGRVVRAALGERSRGPEAMREAAEIEASSETARWFRKIEPLNVLGNLGPLVGLAGTVWGMILAFTSLGATEGQAGPAELSVGISKALFHTLLGLMLAIPCLLVFGLYRSVIDRLCTRAIAESSRLVGKLTADEEARA